MKTPGWAYVIGILMMLIGSCSVVKNIHSIMLPGILEEQKEKIEKAKTDSLARILTSTNTKQSNQTYNPSIGKNAAMLEKLSSVPDSFKIWIVRLGYVGLIPSLLYILAGVFLLIKKKFSLKLAYTALAVSTVFSFSQWIIFSEASHGYIGLSSGIVQIFGIIINLILFAVIFSSDKSAYLDSNTEKNPSVLPLA